MSNKNFSNTNPTLDSLFLTGITNLQNEAISGNAVIQGNLSDNGNTSIIGNLNVNGSTNIIGNTNSSNTLNGSTACQALTANSLVLSGNITTTGLGNNIGGNTAVTNMLGTCNTNIFTCATINGITNTNLNYVSGLSSNAQTQISSKQATITSSTDITAHNVVVNQLNSIPASTINYISSLTSDAQSQINSKQAAITSSIPVTAGSITCSSETDTGNLSVAGTTSLAGVLISGNLALSGTLNSIPASTLNYVSNLSSDAQSQINSKQATLTSGTDVSVHNLTVNQINSIPTTTLNYVSTLTSDVQNQISNIMLKPCNWTYGVSTYKYTDPFSNVSYKYPDLTQRPSVYLNFGGSSTTGAVSAISTALLEIHYELVGAYSHSTTPSSAGIQSISYTSGSPPTNLLNGWYNLIEVYQEPASVTLNSNAYMLAGWGSQSNSKASLLGSCNYMRYLQSSPASAYVTPTAVPFIPLTPLYVSNNKMQLIFGFPTVATVLGSVTNPGYICGIRIAVRVVNSNSCIIADYSGYFGMQNNEIIGGGFSSSGGAYLSSS